MSQISDHKQRAYEEDRPRQPHTRDGEREMDQYDTPSKKIPMLHVRTLNPQVKRNLEDPQIVG